MKLLELIRTIEQHRGRPQRSYTVWDIGTTSNRETLGHGFPKLLCLLAESEAEANEVVKHFRILGMKDGQYALIPPGTHVFVHYNR